MRLLKRLKKKKKFALKKLKKPPSEKLKFNFFPSLPAQPKWPKQRSSCSKMWPIDQLYIELGLRPRKVSNQQFTDKKVIVG